MGSDFKWRRFEGGIILLLRDHSLERPRVEFSSLDHACRLDRGLAGMAGDKTAAIRFDHVTNLEQPERLENLPEEPRDRGFAGAGVAGEDQMQRDI